MQIAPSYPRFWTTDRQPLTGEALAVAQRAYEGAGAEGVTFDDSVVPEVTVMRSAKEQEEFDYTVALNHRQLPMQAANTSLVTIEEQLSKVQKSIARERPGLAKSSWDITVIDGKIAITGSLNDSDKEWFASRLNGNFALSSAVRTYMQAATDYLETTEDNPRYDGMSTQEMEKLYKGNLSRAKSRSRVLYDRLRMSAPQEICPLCQHRAVRTLDHYLPKSAHPALALTPLNLVPACSDCNKDKLHRVANAEDEQPLHPYFDVVDEVQWLAAEVQQSSPPALMFHVRLDAALEPVMLARLKAHFDMFGLARLYSIQAGSEIAGIRFVLQGLHRSGGTQALQQHLALIAEGWRFANQNSWQAVTYSTLAASEWYCTEGYAMAG